MDDAAFRAMVRDFVEANCPAEIRHLPRRLHWPEIETWTRALAAHGWLAPAWPKDHGGMGLSAGKQIAFVEEMDRLGVPRAPDHGIIMLGPLVIRFGTPEQKAKFLPRILSCDDIWCQGYSEPNSGSDLASLRTEAVLDGDHWIVYGQKTWTTLAQDANWIFLLVRTDKTAKKQEGISFLVADLTTPGITRRPIRTLGGHEEFCETFFDNVRVPKENMIGELNKGWTMAKALLGFERIFLGSPKQSQVALNRLALLGRAKGLFADERFRERFTTLRLDVADLTETYGRFVNVLKRGEDLGPDVSILKVFGTALYQRITEALVEYSDEQGAIDEEAALGNDKLDVLGHYWLARPATIYGGSSEIQKNILAKAVLDLPAV
jgi:alkylation response protein AidB-like acyl-CoA dehydrogenase